MPSLPKQPKKPARFRRTKRLCLAAAALLLLTVLAFPIWSVWIAKPLARSLAGVEIETIETLAWDRWQINGISLEKPAFTFQASHLELPSPTQLAFQHFSSSAPTQTLVLENWTLATKPASPPKDPAAPAPTLQEIIALTNQSLSQLSRYLSAVELKNGAVQIAETETLSIAQAKLSPAAFAADLTYLPQNLPASLAIDFANPDAWKLSAQADTLHLTTELDLVTSIDDLSLSGTLTTSTNPVAIAAHWPIDSHDFLPSSAEISSQKFTLDQRYPFWGDAPSLTVQASANWQDHAFDYQITGSPTADAPAKPAISLAGSGSKDRLEIRSAQVDLPWLAMANDQPISLDFNLDNPLQAAQIEAHLDLSRIPFIQAEGTLTALLQTSPTDTKLPLVTASLQGADISLLDTTIAEIEAHLELLGQTVTLRSLRLLRPDGSSLSANGSYDLANKTIAASQLDFNLLSTPLPLAKLMPQIAWQTLSGELAIDGPALDPNLKGKLAATQLQAPSLLPFDLVAEFQGQLKDLHAKLLASHETEQLTLAAHTTQDDTSLTLSISELALATRDGSPLLKLENTFTTRIQKSGLTIESSGIVLSGANETQVVVDSFTYSPHSLSLKADISSFDPSSLNRWLATPLPPLKVIDFNTQLALSETQSSIASSGVASWPLSETNSIDISWLVNSDPDQLDNLIIDHLDIGVDSKHILVAEGRFPVSINWAASSLRTQIHQTAPLAFTLQSSPHPDFWKTIGRYLPIALTRPVVNAKLTGTLEKPEGTFDLQLTSLQWNNPQDAAKSIALQDIKASILATSNSLSVRALEATSGNNNIRANATIPLDDTSPINLIQRKQTLDFKKLDAHASLVLNDLESLKAWLPAIMRQEGKANIEIDMRPDKITAVANIENLATRPLPPLGAISKITGQIRFEDGIWKAERITGLAEKSPFTLSGQADLRNLEQPVYDIAFNSKEFPLLRDSGILFTGDIDMRLVSEKKAKPILKGNLRLTKGLFLVEPDIFASTTKTVQNRPPYFAVTQEPFNDWGLNINIRGDKFLRVSNSFFEGLLSAEFNLEGTLGNPLLIGRATADSGRIFFPASSLDLTNGQAFITRDRPNELQIETSAQARLFAHDVNLTVNGPIEKLELTITTNPALTQVEALLLLTTGALPNALGDIAQRGATSLGIFIGKGLFRKITGGNSDVASKLDIQVGKDISVGGKKTIEASYKLTETLQIETEYDKRDEYNANLKWTIFKR